MYLGNAAAGFTFSMDYAGSDRMTLGGLLQSNSIELAKLVENFAVILQSRQHVILINGTVFRFGCSLLPMKSVKHRPLQAPW